MKTMNLNVIKNLGSKVPFGGGEKSEETVSHVIHGKTLNPYICSTYQESSEGDMLVVYQDKASVAQQYRRAIAALDLDEADSNSLQNFYALDTFRAQLEKHVTKTKLWNYAPQQRADVKQARSFLQNILTLEIPYGETLLVSADEMEAFLADEAQCFGVAEYYYCTREQSLLDPIRHQAARIGHTLEQGVEHFITEPVHRVQHLAENAIEKVPSPTIPSIQLLSA